MQIGVKEISHQGWGNYVRHFSELKVVMTGRDPRDIYISVYNRWNEKQPTTQQALTPDSLSAKLNDQFQIQLALRANTDCMEVRYEDLCLDQSIFKRIKDFVHSPIPTVGEIGQFNIQHPKRKDEYQLHGDKLTRKSVQRWRNEPNRSLVENAHKVFENMPEYTEFWGYKRG
jgi:hypothetical protein